MEIKELQDCKFVSDICQVGSTVEFKTVLYSPVSMQMEHVTISCPMSGNYILTDVAKIIEGDVGVPEIGHKELLQQVFSSLEQSTAISNTLDKKEISNDSSDTKMQSLAIGFLDALSQEELECDPEALKFKFLRVCSDNFTKAHERYTTTR